MGRTKRNTKETESKLDKAMTKEQQEEYFISLAMRQTEKQLLAGTAPASTVNYYLRLAGSRERLEREAKEATVDLLRAKASNIKNSENETKAYLEAIEAIKSYGYDRSAN